MHERQRCSIWISELDVSESHEVFGLLTRLLGEWICIKLPAA